MLLTMRHSYELLAKHGVFAREICDKCGLVLGPVRFTRRGESGEWCSRTCRDGQPQITQKTGRPRKYRNAKQRCAAKARQQRGYRSKQRQQLLTGPSVEKSVCIQSETKGLQVPQSPLSYYPLSWPVSARKTAAGEKAGSRA